MKIAGIVAEYNPFHNGHLYHLQQAKESCGADFTVCVMSGHFLQRGEPAIFDKWSRAAMAVAAGADVVFELPAAFACRSAAAFARGGVALLTATNTVTHLCFGSETGSLEQLNLAARILADEPPAYRALLRTYLKTGISYPLARSRSLQAYAQNTQTATIPSLSTLLASPNNILGVEYLIALNRSGNPLQPVAVKRRQAAYHDLHIAGPIASATAIRTALQTADLSVETRTALPASTIPILQRCIAQGLGPVFPNALSTIALAAIRRMPPEELLTLVDVTEGLENKLKTAANATTDWDNLLKKLKSKRYTRTRLQRIIIYSLLSFTKELAAEFDENGPCYLRVLAFSKQGQTLLRKISDRSALPIIQRVAEFTDSSHYTPTSTLEKMLQLDVRATDLYALVQPTPQRGGLDFLTGAVRITED